MWRKRQKKLVIVRDVVSNTISSITHDVKNLVIKKLLQQQEMQKKRFKPLLIDIADESSDYSMNNEENSFFVTANVNTVKTLSPSSLKLQHSVKSIINSIKKNSGTPSSLLQSSIPIKSAINSSKLSISSDFTPKDSISNKSTSKPPIQPSSTSKTPVQTSSNGKSNIKGHKSKLLMTPSHSSHKSEKSKDSEGEDNGNDFFEPTSLYLRDFIYCYYSF